VSNKSLVVYTSQTGNTEKVALRFKKAFENKNWKCDIFKVTQETDFNKLPFDYKNYDFLCVGSTVTRFMGPTDEIKNILDPPHPPPPANIQIPKGPTPIKPIRFNSDSKKGVVFVTYAGYYMGPKEPEPALSYMSLMMEWRLKFQCVGKFACPGKYQHHIGWYKDLDLRPSERDLIKAETFIEETIEENYINGF